ncbi:MAG: RNA polymerase sporulation sigma factor SigH [Armatimonadetes bacterium]|nr:RNA polymerase sporulation sigma factor SigH [Armatimonadota bacterium]
MRELFDPCDEAVLSRKYDALADSELVSLAQGGRQDAAEHILYKYRNLVRSKVKSYFLVGAEREDLLQVGMIGLWQAIVDYRHDKATSFPAFAKVCIHRHIITAIKAATRQKQLPLNQSLSLEVPGDEESSEWNMADVLQTGDDMDPEEVLLKREDSRHLRSLLHQMLSEFEWKVLAGYQMGKSYREIARELHCKTKSVDNALMRIKRKVSMVDVDIFEWSYAD